MGRAIKAGRVWTNCYHLYPAHAAFGGYKVSGVGRETHKMMLDHYTQTKCCSSATAPSRWGSSDRLTARPRVRARGRRRPTQVCSPRCIGAAYSDAAARGATRRSSRKRVVDDVAQFPRIPAEVVELAPAAAILDVEGAARVHGDVRRRAAVVQLARPEVLDHEGLPPPLGPGRGGTARSRSRPAGLRGDPRQPGDRRGEVDVEHRRVVTVPFPAVTACARSAAR